MAGGIWKHWIIEMYSEARFPRNVLTRFRRMKITAPIASTLLMPLSALFSIPVLAMVASSGCLRHSLLQIPGCFELGAHGVTEGALHSTHSFFRRRQIPGHNSKKSPCNIHNEPKWERVIALPNDDIGRGTTCRVEALETQLTAGLTIRSFSIALSSYHQASERAVRLSEKQLKRDFIGLQGTHARRTHSFPGTGNFHFLASIK